MIIKTIRRVQQFLPRILRARFAKKTVVLRAPKYKRGARGDILEIKGEYHAQTGTIYLYDIHGRHIREKHIFYYYAHECGHKYYHEYIGGNELKNLLTLMSQWPLQEERYSGYRVVRKIEEIFSDVFALFLRMRHYQAKGMKKAEKIRKALDKKAPGGVEFLKKSFKETSKNSNNKPSETYPVTHLDFERIEKIFGSNLL